MKTFNQPLMSYIIHFSRKMLTFLSYITHLITGVFITEDPKMSSLHLKKKMHREHFRKPISTLLRY